MFFYKRTMGIIQQDEQIYTKQFHKNYSKNQ